MDRIGFRTVADDVAVVFVFNVDAALEKTLTLTLRFSNDNDNDNGSDSDIVDMIIRRLNMVLYDYLF